MDPDTTVVQPPSSSQPLPPLTPLTTQEDDLLDSSSPHLLFGPVLSPERRFRTRSVNLRSMRTPQFVTPATRRSTRLSLVPPPLFAQPQLQLEAEGRAGEGVVVLGEDEDGALDRDMQDDDLEPSSALASRISRAHDNPSPPPRMRDLSTAPGSRSPSPVICPEGKLIDLSYENDSPEQLEQLLSIQESLHATNPLHLPSTETSSSISDIVMNDLMAAGTSDSTAAGAPDESPDKSMPPSRNEEILQVSRDASALALVDTADIGASEGPGESSEVHDEALPSCTPETANPSVEPPSAEPCRPQVTRLLASPSRKPATPTPSPTRKSNRLSPLPPLLPEQLITLLPTSPAPEAMTAVNADSRLLGVPAASSPLRRSPRLSRSPVKDTLPAMLPPNPPSPTPAVASPSQSPQRSPSPTRASIPLRRELGSLSPNSADLLSGLSLDTTIASDINNAMLPSLTLQRPPATPQRSSAVPVDTDVHSPSRKLFAVQRPPPSPLKSTIRSSPPKRVPVGQAVAQSSVSLFGGPVFSRPFLQSHTDSVPRSPARRILADQAMPPVKPPPNTLTRTGSAEPQPFRKMTKLPSSSLSDSETSNPMRTVSQLPFPLRVAEAIFEEGDTASSPPSQSTTASVPALPNPMKSQLRQPSEKVAGSSRIPRSKPYARPPDKARTTSRANVQREAIERTRASTLAVKAEKTIAVKPKGVPVGRIVTRHPASGIARTAKPSSGAADNRAPSSSNSASVPSTSKLSAPSTRPPALKRKRPGESQQRKLSPPASQSQPVFRKVTRAPRTGALAKPPSPEPELGSSSLAKTNVVKQFRRVVPATKKAVAAPPSAPPPPTEQLAGDFLDIMPTSPPVVVDAQQQPDASSAIRESSPPLSGPSEIPDATGVGTASIIELPPLPDNAGPLSPHPELSGPAVPSGRRTRSGRTPSAPADVFSRTRRDVPGGVFATMSATALRALTSSNTMRNQHYTTILTLDTEVVRRPGQRPTSPQTKVRTVEEKRKEEMLKGRRDRAERRARRASGEDGDVSVTAADADVDEVWVDNGKHRRGAGEDSEYVTPERQRPAKRTHSGSEGENEEWSREKRVKWDRGLFSTVYYDERVSGQRMASKLPPAHKGALAGSAKTLRLDTLGNLVNCSSPIKDVLPENVVVKKFVYDDDDDAQAIEPESPSDKPSKGKRKAKS